MDLDQLARQHGTDKSSLEHNYCPLYERYFAPLRDNPITLLELGVWHGASLRMWRDYFPNATIVGLDRTPTVETNCYTYVGDQGDIGIIDKVSHYHGPFDIIIDDASHISSGTIRSFELLWPHLAPGGVYVIEDLQTSYDAASYGIAEANPHPDLQPIAALSAMQFCKRLADEVNQGLYDDQHWWGYEIASVQFFRNICFITRVGDEPTSR